MTSGGHALLRQRIPGTAEAVRTHLERLETVTNDHDLGGERCADMLVVLAEVLNNIVEHAFEEQEAGWIDCKISRKPGCFAIETCDNGIPLPPSLLSSGTLPDMGADRDDLPEGGFGWFIVHSLTNDMIYEREDGKNRLSFSLQIG
ncbi:ATP-binding protein [Jannaschia sp. M317]|uniref:ATP-binding protein n=1 Tax=Jannaschia sp. M317 TaxID=2867011 RepID=UPI0021A2E2EA|nr:ATP-binding protein [Jannaschia sp. M317]UWQ17720.1 ATP-binding protein [Jannaschia sp. M317]